MANKAEFVGAFFSAIKMLAGKQRKRKYKKREPEKERETNRKRKIAGRHFGVINAISISLSKYGATFRTYMRYALS